MPPKTRGTQCVWSRGADVEATALKLFPSLDPVNGLLEKPDMMKLLRALGRDGGQVTGAGLVQARLDISAASRGTPQLRDVKAWYQRQTKNRTENVKRNRLLVKDTIGYSRASGYNLPEDDHTYGHANHPDKEGAGAGSCAAKERGGACGAGGYGRAQDRGVRWGDDVWWAAVV